MDNKYIKVTCIRIIILILTLFAQHYTSEVLKKRKLYDESCVNCKFGPSGMEDTDATTCEQFSQFARFNPYSVLNDKWMAFYFWDHRDIPYHIIFLAPTAKELQFLHDALDFQVKEPINWTARLLIMRDLSDNSSYLLTERGDRGQYWCYLIQIYGAPPRALDPADIRFKQTGDNKYLALMKCDKGLVHVFARTNDVPRHKDIPEVISRLGFRSRGGKSYLYQGHRWMPIPEMTDAQYWLSKDLKNPENRKRFILDYIFD